MQHAFAKRFFPSLIADCYEYQADNFPFVRYDLSIIRRSLLRLADQLLRLLGQIHFVRRPRSLQASVESLEYIVSNLDDFELCHDLMQDDYSKGLFVEILKFRVLGYSRVKLPLNNDAYKGLISSIDSEYRIQKETVRTGGNWRLNLYRVPGSNGPISLHAHTLNILGCYALEQLAYRKGDSAIDVNPGDIAIDGGACWGDTALYLADKVGDQGRVYCFEFLPENLDILRMNLQLNPQIASRIEVLPNALWDTPNKSLIYEDSGPGTLVTGAWNAGTEQRGSFPPVTVTDSIDNFVQSRGISKVDYIKLDIEGAELSALKGARETIKAFRPKLAVSIYHKLEDFVLIPKFLNDLEPSYQLFIDHFTSWDEETMLFAKSAG